jgi:hypothetical protein
MTTRNKVFAFAIICVAAAVVGVLLVALVIGTLQNARANMDQLPRISKFARNLDDGSRLRL